MYLRTTLVRAGWCQGGGANVAAAYGPSRNLLNHLVISWAQQDLNLRLQPCEGCTLPLSYAPEGRDHSQHFSDWQRL
jgi:hypothetical protein